MKSRHRLGVRQWSEAKLPPSEAMGQTRAQTGTSRRPAGECGEKPHEFKDADAPIRAPRHFYALVLDHGIPGILSGATEVKNR